MKELDCVNGTIFPPGKATIPAADRGALFGDGVYEVVRSYDGRLWAFERHMRRLERSLRQIWIHNADMRRIRAEAQELYGQSGIPNARLYIQITRGPADRDYPIPKNVEPTVMMTVRELREDRSLEQGARVVTLPDLRWRRVDIKSLNLMANLMAKKEAHERGALEAVLVDGRGVMTEGASSSLFIVQSGAVVTRETGPHILPGVTREIAIECALEAGLQVKQRAYSIDEFRAADEAFLTGTSIGVCPIALADDRPVGSGTPGPAALTIRDRYRERVRQRRDAPQNNNETDNAPDNLNNH